MSADEDELPDVPPFNGLDLVKLHRAGLHDAIARLRAGAKKRELERERDRFLQLAGVLIAGDLRRQPSEILSRMNELTRRSGLRTGALPIDIGTIEGALAAALLVTGWKVPGRITIWRALGKRREKFSPTPGLELRSPVFASG